MVVLRNEPPLQLQPGALQPSATPASPAGNEHTANGPCAPAATVKLFGDSGQPLLIRLEVVGDQPRSIDMTTLKDQDDLTETTWPQFMVCIRNYKYNLMHCFLEMPEYYPHVIIVVFIIIIISIIIIIWQA